MAQQVAKWREWIAEKLNPVQGSIAMREGTKSPESSVNFEHAYRDIEVIHRAIEMIVNACVEMPLTVEGGAEKKIGKLLNTQPNPFEDKIRLYRRAYLDFLLHGNAFFYYDNSNLYVLPAQSVTIVPDEKTFVKRYEYATSAASSTSWGKKPGGMIEFTPDEIIHIRDDNQDSIYRGASRLKSLTRIIELYYSLTDFQRQFFKNNAVPGFVLTTENVLSTKIKERLLAQWSANYTSLFQGARSPAILDGGLKVDKFSQLNFQELDFEASIDRLQQDMTKGLGVPYVLLKSGNNANLTANQNIFYYHTVLPILTSFCSAFTQYFGSGDVKIYPDKFSVTALQPDMRAQVLYVSTLVNSGIITPDEGRVIIRMLPKGGEMDKIRIPENITGSATNPSVGGRPAA